MTLAAYGGADLGGVMGTEGCGHIVDAIDVAIRERCPVIGLWHCGGDGSPRASKPSTRSPHVFNAMIRASGRVPRISVVPARPPVARRTALPSPTS
jgi:acetyl-CoA/propionyl-CoA carboxylase carboxyl transferase subunit